MGYTRVEMTITGQVSSHNSEQDRRDDEAWASFRRVVEELAKEPRYADLLLDVWGYAG